jgi:RND family efflux transporter MFP subunit
MLLKQTTLALWLAASAVAVADDAPKPVVVVTAVKAPVLTTVELTGSVTARRQASLSSRTDGLIRKLLVDSGDVVKSGDLLMELDDELAVLALERVIAGREQAEVILANATRLETEASQLTKTGAFARSEAESRKTALKVGETELRRGVALEKEQRSLVERHRLLAPFDGVISMKLAEEGEWVETGTPVVELVETGSLRMDVQAPQELYPMLRKNPEITIRLDAYPAESLGGRITAIVPVKDAVARTFLVRMEIDDPGKLAAAGMSGRVTLTFSDDKGTMQIPRDAIIRLPDGTTKVWVVDQSGNQAITHSTTVKTGRGLGESIEIIEGIENGSRIVVRGNESLTEGQLVSIIPAAPESTPAAR